jgi:hypothetical protein
MPGIRGNSSEKLAPQKIALQIKKPRFDRSNRGFAFVCYKLPTANFFEQSPFVSCKPAAKQAIKKQRIGRAFAPPR